MRMIRGKTIGEKDRVDRSIRDHMNIIEALEAPGITAGLSPEDASHLARSTVTGAAALLDEFFQGLDRRDGREGEQQEVHGLILQCRHVGQYPVARGARAAGRGRRCSPPTPTPCSTAWGLGPGPTAPTCPT